MNRQLVHRARAWLDQPARSAEEGAGLVRELLGFVETIALTLDAVRCRPVARLDFYGPEKRPTDGQLIVLVLQRDSLSAKWYSEAGDLRTSLAGRYVHVKSDQGFVSISSKTSSGSVDWEEVERWAPLPAVPEVQS